MTEHCRKLSHLQTIKENRKSLFSHSDPGSTKVFFSCNEEVYVSKEVIKKMLSTRIKGKVMPTSNKLQKINMHVTTSQYETSSKNNVHLLSRNQPTREKNHWRKQHFGTR